MGWRECCTTSFCNCCLASNINFVLLGTYVQELHKNQIKNDEPQIYTCTIKDGRERGEIHSDC